MALSGVRSSWLMVARKRVFDASACSAAVRARSSACSWSLRSVTSRITATTSASASAVRRSEACSSGRQRISTQMKSTWFLAPRAAARHFPPETKFDAARLAAARRIRQRGEIGRTIGDMDAVEQAMPQQPRYRRAQHRFHRGRNELHRAVAAMARDHVAHVARQQPIAILLDIEQRDAGARQRLGAEGKPGGIERRRCHAERHEDAARDRSWHRGAGNRSKCPNTISSRGAGQRQRGRERDHAARCRERRPPAAPPRARSRRRIRCRRWSSPPS